MKSGSQQAQSNQGMSFSLAKIPLSCKAKEIFTHFYEISTGTFLLILSHKPYRYMNRTQHTLQWQLWLREEGFSEKEPSCTLVTCNCAPRAWGWGSYAVCVNRVLNYWSCITSGSFVIELSEIGSTDKPMIFAAVLVHICEFTLFFGVFLTDRFL